MADDPVAKGGWKLSDRITGTLGGLMSIALGVYLYYGGQLRNRSGQLIGGTPRTGSGGSPSAPSGSPAWRSCGGPGRPPAPPPIPGP